MSLNVKVDFQARGELAKYAALVTGSGPRTALARAMGEEVRETVRVHVQQLAMSRHDTANRLGASPSGFLDRAARAVEEGPLSADAIGATLTINHPGLARALRDVTIRPTSAKALAIPVAALAYNRRPRQFGATELFLWKSPITGNAFLAKRREEKGAPLELMYMLVRSVHQKQDRTLLPSDTELSTAALDAAEAWFADEIAELSAT